ncbi:MAG: ABC transporter ATP-binding protein [Firmicutes bacterium]|nr:ABC transporter ATP-binding protein [Bacillota bacterium]
MANFKKILSLLKPHAFYYSILLMLVLASNFFKLYPPMLIRELVDFGIPSGDLNYIKKLLLFYVLLWVLRGIVVFIQWYGFEMLGQKLSMQLRLQLHDKLQRLSLSYFSKTQTGSVLAKITEDVDIIQQFACWSFLDLISNTISIIGTTYFLFRISPTLAAKTLLMLPLLFFIVYRFNKIVRPAWEAVREQMDNLTSSLQENISGVRVVKAFAREKFEIEKFKKENIDYRDKNITRARLEARYNPLMELVTAFAIIAFLFFGGLEYYAGKITMGDMLSFNMYLWEFMWPIRMLGFLINMLNRALAATPRVFEILEMKIDIEEKDDPTKISEVKGNIKFTDVSFSFADDPDNFVLQDINLEIKPGERVAIVGATGSGKTTLINLIARFHDVSQGAIYLDGVDIRDISLKQLRTNIGMVLQETFLFSTSIGDNIAFGSPQADVESVKNAAETAQISDFIDTLPHGYHTLVGERGLGLSGGQKQRVALARAILMDPKVLILDEATSSVDIETEQRIQKALEKIMEQRTTIIIAKRLSTIQNADRVIILEEGKIAEMGNHLELLALNGSYARLFAQQMERIEKTDEEVI